MDPLSLTASVAGVVTILVQTIKITKGYVDGVRNSSDSARSFLAELTALSSNLERLSEVLKNGSPQAKVFEQTSALITQSSRYEEKLKMLETKLRNVTSSRIRQALWPLSEGEHRQAIQDLRAFSQWIQFSLSLDSSILLSKSAEDISKILSAQLNFITELNRIEHRISAIESSVQTQEFLSIDAAEQEQFEKCLAWIPSIDQDSKHADIKEPRVEDTGDWLLEDPLFKLWKDGGDQSSQHMLWCHGDQGAGKSVLASRIIDVLQDEVDDAPLEANLAFAYLQRQERDVTTTLKILGSLAKQLLFSLGHIPEEFLKKFKRAKRGSQPDLQSVKRLLLQASLLAPKTYIVVDALDEGGHTDLTDCVRQLAQAVTVRLCVTSRSHDFSARISFKDATKIHIRAHDADIKRYIERQIDRNPTAVIADLETRATIIDSITAKTQQISRGAECAYDWGDERSTAQVPDSLERVFDNTMLQIAALPKDKRQLARKTLTWLSYIQSGHKLQTSDLCVALSLRLNQKITNKEYQPHIDTVIDCCQGLVAVETTTECVVFIHDAVREYLRERQRSNVQDKHKDLADFCLIYLHTEPTLETIFSTETELEASLAQSPFLRYTIFAWSYHVRLSQNEHSMQSAIDLLKLRQRRNCLLQLLQYLKGRRKLYWDIKEAESQTDLHVATGFGFIPMIRTLLEQETHDVNAPSLLGTTPLMISSSNGDREIIHLLLKHGADPTIMNWYGNSLHAAAEAGQYHAIDTLLEYPSHSTKELPTWINFPNSHGYTAVECASMENHASTVQKLLEWGAISSELVLNGCIFEFMLNQDDSVVKLLGDQTADSFVAAFSAALAKKDISFIIRAMEYCGKRDYGRRHSSGYNAKPSDEDAFMRWSHNYKIKPLHLAAGFGDITTVKRLLDAGADANGGTNSMLIHDKLSDENGRAIDGSIFTPYAFAAAKGHVAVQELLLQYGAIPPLSIDEAQIDRFLAGRQ